MVREGREAVAVCRNLMGLPTAPRPPPAPSAATSRLSVQNNLVHGSDSPENAARDRPVVQPGGTGRVHGDGRGVGGVR